MKPTTWMRLALASHLGTVCMMIRSRALDPIVIAFAVIVGVCAAGMLVMELTEPSQRLTGGMRAFIVGQCIVLVLFLAIRFPNAHVLTFGAALGAFVGVRTLVRWIGEKP